MPRIHARRRPPALPQDAPAPDSAPLEAIRRFLPYLWPKDDADLRRRAVISLAFLVSQKGVAVVIPLLFGAAVDLVSGGTIHHPGPLRRAGMVRPRPPAAAGF